MNKKVMLIPMLALFLMAAIPAVMASTTVDFNIDGGILDITVKGYDHTSWHPGVMGEQNSFSALGSFSGTYRSTEGVYGKLYTEINARTGTGGGSLYVSDYQDFNILSANYIYNTEGFFEAGASGSYAELNMKFVGSMYVWSEADNRGANCLVGSSIWKHAYAMQNDELQGEISIGISTTGIAKMWNDADWGFGIGERGTVTADYRLTLNHISATGDGIYSQYAYGKDSVEFNGILLNNGGECSIIGGFTDGFSETYSMAGS